MRKTTTKKRVGETIIISHDDFTRDPISIKILGLHGYYINFGVALPDGFNIYKKEVYENIKASKNKLLERKPEEKI